MANPSCDLQLPVGVIFDGDDTLWETEQLYDGARSRARLVVEDSGLCGIEWEELERRIDVKNVSKYRYSPERFPTSCVQAYEELCRREALPPNQGIAARIREAACSVFWEDPPVVAGAKETLALLRAKGMRLALLTKGDRELQLRRIERTGLREFFDVIRIVPEKSSSVISETLAAMGVDKSRAWVVGNSIRSDVLPAAEAGVRAIRIPSHVWEYERAMDRSSVKGMITAKRLAEIPALITT
jgi:putative hydrolase of the HAD superfamily